MLSADDFRRIMDCVRLLHGWGGVVAFGPRAVAAVAALVDGDAGVFTTTRLPEMKVTAVRFPAKDQAVEPLATFSRCNKEYPAFVRFRKTGDPGEQLLSDPLSVRALHRMDLFNRYHRLLETEDQIGFCVAVSQSLHLTVTVNRRRRNFTDRDRDALAIVQPHFIEAHRNAQVCTALEHAVVKEFGPATEGRCGVIALESDAAVAWMTDSAEKLLKVYFSSARRMPGKLPDALVNWVSRCDLKVNGALPNCSPLVVAKGKRRLIAHLLRPAGQERLILFMETNGAVDGAGTGNANGNGQSTGHRIHAPHLSPRLEQVLRLLLSGDSTKQIAVKLDLSHHTVNEYIETLYRRCGVSSRGELLSRFVRR